MHLLFKTQKQTRVEWSCEIGRVDWSWREIGQRFENEISKCITEILTGDETWIYRYDPMVYMSFLTGKVPKNFKDLETLETLNCCQFFCLTSVAIHAGKLLVC